MKQYFFLLAFFFSVLNLSSQSYRVYLKDKGTSKEILQSPESFLSEAALIRRAAQNIEINNSDLPVAKEYIQTIRDLGGTIKARSKWLNYLFVEGLDFNTLMALDFVESVEVPKLYQSHLATGSTTFDYGVGETQIEMISGDLLHQEGYTGRGVTIAVIDAGYRGVWEASVLDSLKLSGRLKGSYNFINGDTNVYTGQGSHGASVLSTMAALDTGTFVGTAPHANYWLLTSEDIGSETPVEMDNWLMAAEFADSVGAHVINTSLGYTTFDDPADDYSYSDMDGNTTVVTRAADWAASKGIIVVASAGNEGSGSWQYISAPADGDSVLAVGAVDATSTYVAFSSRGPSYDWRIKPDVAAMGAGTVLINAVGNLQGGFGTSFSSPLIAGMAACMVQAQPTLHGEVLARNIRRSGHLFGNANNELGFGIPNFYNAWQIGIEEIGIAKGFKLYPNPSRGKVFLHGSFDRYEALEIDVFAIGGNKVMTIQSTWENQSIELDISSLDPGLYILKINGNSAQQQKILLQ